MESGQNDNKNKCRICNTKLIHCFNHTVLKKYNVAYFQCPECGLLQTEDPFWLNETYANNHNISYDTGYVYRNIYYSKQISKFIYYLYDKDSSFVDYGGGYGLFTRLMRDTGFNFYWADEYSENIFAKGFELNDKQRITGITAFEVFEHLPDVKTILDLFVSNSCDFIFFSTKLYGNAVPEPEKWSYYSFEGGGHISFYNEKTLKYLAEKYKIYFFSNSGQLHLFSRKKISNWKWIALNNKYTNRLFSVRMNSRILSDSNYLKKL